MPKRIAALLAFLALAAAPLFLAAPAALAQTSGTAPSAAPVPVPAPGTAPSAGPALPSDPAECLGLDIGALIGRFGAPASVEAFRGPEAWQDDVVFDYPGGLSFFVYKDRVWQLRLHGSYAGALYGASLGDAEDAVAAALGAPEASDGDSRWYRRPDRGYPVRLRALFRDGKAADLYLYRADF